MKKDLPTGFLDSLLARMEGQQVDSLSSGQQQLVALARVMVRNPLDPGLG